jgi:hypothetical protein
MTFRPLDQKVPDTKVNVFSQTAITMMQASVWQMGCGWNNDWLGPW